MAQANPVKAAFSRPAHTHYPGILRRSLRKRLESGAFLIMYMGNKPPNTPDAIWLISRDESIRNYTVLYYDTRKVSRIYEMSFSNGIWKMWRNSPDFSQRFEGKFSDDGNIITAHWEKSSHGSTWEHDFDVTYAKVK